MRRVDLLVLCGLDDRRVCGLAACPVERLVLYVVVDRVVPLVTRQHFDDLLRGQTGCSCALVVAVEIYAHRDAVLLAALDIRQELAVRVQSALSVARGIAHAQQCKARIAAAVHSAQFAGCALPVDRPLLLANMKDADLAPLEAAAEDVGVSPTGYYTTHTLCDAFLAKCDQARMQSFAPLFEGSADAARAALAALLPNTFLQALVWHTLTAPEAELLPEVNQNEDL